MTARPNDYWRTAHDAAMRGDFVTAAKFSHLAMRVGCGQECLTPGAQKPGGQHTNGGCRCAEMLSSVINSAAARWLCDVEVVQAADAWAEAAAGYNTPEGDARREVTEALLYAAVKARKEARTP